LCSPIKLHKSLVNSKRFDILKAELLPIKEIFERALANFTVKLPIVAIDFINTSIYAYLKIAQPNNEKSATDFCCIICNKNVLKARMRLHIGIN
jgi:hypothetical protein